MRLGAALWVYLLTAAAFPASSLIWSKRGNGRRAAENACPKTISGVQTLF